jgi:colanic acid/amylovoran biosynthesis protein
MRAPMRILVEPSDYVLLNSGDTAMLEVAVSRLSALRPDAVIEVLTDIPDRYPFLGPNVQPLGASGRHAFIARRMRLREQPPGFLINRQSVRRWIRKVVGVPGDSKAAKIEAFVDHVRRADLVVATGMGGITDAFPEYTLGLLTTVELAIRHGAVTAMMGQGIGPLTKPDLIAHAKQILPKVDLISLRERRASEPLLRSLGVPADRIMTTGDDAIEMAYDARVGAGQPGRGLGINLRAALYAEVDATMVVDIRNAIQQAAHLLGAPLIPVPISRFPGEADHVTISALLSSGTGEKADGGVSIDSPRKVIDQIRMCRAVVTGSYHAAVFAMAMGVPVVGLGRSSYYIDKFYGLAEQFGGGCEVVRLEVPVVESTIVEAIERAWRSADAMRPQLLAAAAHQVELSRAAYRKLNDLLSVRRRRWWPAFFRV